MELEVVAIPLPCWVKEMTGGLNLINPLQQQRRILLVWLMILAAVAGEADRDCLHAADLEGIEFQKFDAEELVRVQRTLALEALAGKFVDRLRPAYHPNEIVSSSGLQNDSLIPDGEELLLRVLVDKWALTEDLYGITSKNGVYIGLQEFFRIAEFSVDYYQEDQQAKGWYLTPNNDFLLDIAKQKVKVGGNRFKFDEKLVRIEPDDIYVHSALMEQWFDLDFEINYAEMALSIDTDQVFPVVNRMEKRAQLERTQKREPTDPQLPEQEIEYALFRPPFLDFIVGGRLLKRPNMNHAKSGRYSVVGSSDFAYMNAKLFASGRDEELLSEARLTLQRESVNKDLLGPLRASYIGFGEIQSTNLPLVQGSGQERGIRISNTDLGRTTEVDIIQLTGDLQPGSTVELYRNGVLLAFQDIDETGRYDFDDVKLFVGNNDFELVTFSPEREVTRINKSFPVSATGLKTGEIRYEASVSQDGEVTYAHEQKEGSGELNAGIRASIGITRSLSLDLGAQTLEENDERRHIYEVGATTGILSTLIRGSFLYTQDGGMAATGLLSRQFGAHALRGNVDWLDGFYALEDTEIPLTRLSTLDLSGPVPLPGKLHNRLRYSLQSELREFDNGAKDIDVGATVTTRVFKGALSNKIGYRKSESTGVNFDQWLGSTQYTRTIRPLRLRFSSNYSYTPELGSGFKLDSVQAAALWPFTPDLTTDLELTHVRENNFTSGRWRLNWTSDYAIFSPQFSYNTENQMEASVSLRFSAGRDPNTGRYNVRGLPITETGGVSAHVYYDKNANGEFDDGEESVENAEIFIAQHKKSLYTDENGYVFEPGLQKNRPTDVRLVSESLSDPFWIPSKKGRSVTLRPGVISHFEFPVVLAGEIEGTAEAILETGQKISVRNLKLLLFDDKGNKLDETITDFDGFYVFSGVVPGRYMVKAEEPSRKSQGLPKAAPTYLTVKDHGEIYLGANLLFDLANAPQVQYGLELESFPSKFVMSIAWLAKKKQFADIFADMDMLTPGNMSGPVSLKVGPLKTWDEANTVCDQLQLSNQKCSFFTIEH